MADKLTREEIYTLLQIAEQINKQYVNCWMYYGYIDFRFDKIDVYCLICQQKIANEISQIDYERLCHNHGIKHLKHKIFI